MSGHNQPNTLLLADQAQSSYSSHGTDVFLNLPDELLLGITAHINDFVDLSSFFFCCKRTVSILDPDEAWRFLFRLRNWHPRWSFNFYTTKENKHYPDRWRREYLWTLKQCGFVWSGMAAIRRFLSLRPRAYHNFLDGTRPATEAQLAQMEKELQHPLPNDLKEFMRIQGGFIPNQEMIDYIVGNLDLMVDWNSIFFLRPITGWEVFECRTNDTFDISNPPVMYDEDEISEDLPAQVTTSCIEPVVLDAAADDNDSSYESPMSSEESEEFDSDEEETKRILKIGYFMCEDVYSVFSDGILLPDPDTNGTQPAVALDIDSGLILINSDGRHLSDLMRLAMERLSHDRVSFEYVTSSTERQSVSELYGNVDNSASFSLDEDDYAIGTLVHEIMQDYVEDWELSPSAIKLLSLASYDFASQVLAAIPEDSITAEAIQGEILKQLNPHHLRCEEEIRILNSMDAPGDDDEEEHEHEDVEAHEGEDEPDHHRELEDEDKPDIESNGPEKDDGYMPAAVDAADAESENTNS